MRVSLEALISAAATYGLSWSKGNKVHKGVGDKATLVSNKVALLKLMPADTEAKAREVIERVANAIGWTAIHSLIDGGLTIRQQTVRDAIADGKVRNEEAAIMEYVASRALGITSSRTVTVTVEREVVVEQGTRYTMPEQATEAAKAHVEYLVGLGVKANVAVAQANERYAKWLPAKEADTKHQTAAK